MLPNENGTFPVVHAELPWNTFVQNTDRQWAADSVQDPAVHKGESKPHGSLG